MKKLLLLFAVFLTVPAAYADEKCVIVDDERYCRQTAVRTQVTVPQAPTPRVVVVHPRQVCTRDTAEAQEKWTCVVQDTPVQQAPVNAPKQAEPSCGLGCTVAVGVGGLFLGHVLSKGGGRGNYQYRW